MLFIRAGQRFVTAKIRSLMDSCTDLLYRAIVLPDRWSMIRRMARFPS